MKIDSGLPLSICPVLDKVSMTSTLFENWYRYYFIPAVRFYCKRKNLDFKILLIVDNCTAHPDLSYVNENVRMEFFLTTKHNISDSAYGSRCYRYSESTLEENHFLKGP